MATIPVDTLEDGHNCDLLQPLRHEDYPTVKFWTQASWNKFMAEKKHNDRIAGANTQKPSRGSTRKAQGINVRTQYMENEAGIEVDASRAGGARALAKEIFNELTKGKLFTEIPSKWTRVSNKSKIYYFGQMYRRYPELRFCEEDWKAWKLGGKSYSPWYKNYKQQYDHHDGGDDSENSGSDDQHPSSLKRHKPELTQKSKRRVGFRMVQSKSISIPHITYF